MPDRDKLTVWWNNDADVIDRKGVFHIQAPGPFFSGSGKGLGRLDYCGHLRIIPNLHFRL